MIVMKRVISVLLLLSAIITSSTAQNVIVYSYDDAGNRISKSTPSGSSRSAETPEQEKS